VGLQNWTAHVALPSSEAVFVTGSPTSSALERCVVAWGEGECCGMSGMGQRKSVEAKKAGMGQRKSVEA